MEVFGVKFAPMWIPFERRVQTLSVFMVPTLSATVAFGSVFVFAYLLFFTKYYIIPLLYFAWFAYDYKVYNHGGKFSPWVRNWSVFRAYRKYFPVSLVKTADLDPNKNYIFVSHPHGIFCVGAFTNFGTNASSFANDFPGLKPRLLTLPVQFWLPFYRDFVLSVGACAATKEGMEWLLSREGKGNALVLVVGGALEALDAHPGIVSLTLKSRKGFVNLAIKHGASLVPVFSFGENELYDQADNPEGSWLKKFQIIVTKVCGVSNPIFHGRGVFQYSMGYLPYRKPVTTVVGAPIDVKQNPNPTREEVEELHARYVESLEKLFNEHKNKYGYEKVSLQIH